MAKVPRYPTRSIKLPKCAICRTKELPLLSKRFYVCATCKSKANNKRNKQLKARKGVYYEEHKAKTSLFVHQMKTKKGKHYQRWKSGLIKYAHALETRQLRYLETKARRGKSRRLASKKYK